MTPTRLLSLVLATAALNACTISPLVLGPAGGGMAGTPGGAGIIGNSAAMTTVRGTVKAPQNYAAVGGDPFQTAGLIAAGGLNYRLQQGAPLGDEDYVPLSGSEVYLADGQGTPLPGLKPVITNQRGEFTVPNVPQGYTYMVVARAKNKAGKPVTLKTLLSGKEGRGDIDPASTLAAEAIADGAGKDLGQIDPERFRKVRETIRQDLARGGMPDLADKTAVKARIEKLKESNAELRETVDGLRSDLSKAQATIDQLRKELEARQQPGATGEEQPLPCLEGFKRRDKNGDGVVDLAEAGDAARFKELDLDGDGQLRPEELCPPLAPPDRLDCKARFAQLDLNGDGVLEIQEAPNALPGQANHPAFLAQDADNNRKVTLEEYCAKPAFDPEPASCEAAFKRMDDDGDGMLDFEQVLRILPTVNKVGADATRSAWTIDEPGLQRDAVKRMDRNGDGRISLPEFCDKPAVEPDPVPCEALFKRVDLDGDGILTYEESARADQGETGDPNVRFLKERDRDGDGKLTLAEACGGVAPQPADPCGEKFLSLAGRDGLLSYDQASAIGMSKERFVAMDLNQDGSLDRKEYCETVTTMPVEPTCKDKFLRLAGADGVVSYEEAMTAGWADSFKKYDLNQDGVVGPREYGWAFCGEPMPEPQPQPLPPTTGSCDERFKRLAGADGAINPEDMGLAGWNKELFVKYDANQDGKVDRREYGWVFCGEPRPEPVTTTPIATNPCDEKFRLAAGRDGVITLEDLTALGWAKDTFYKYDTNRDGKVDRKEFGAALCGEGSTVITAPTLGTVRTI